MRAPVLLIAAAVLVCGLGAMLFARTSVGGDLEPGLFVLAGLFGSIDFCDMVFRLYSRRAHTRPRGAERSVATSFPLEVGDFTPHQVRHHLRFYAIVVSVYNASKELNEFLEALRPHRQHLWVIDDASTDDTYRRLQRAGIRCMRGEVNRKKPGALKELLSTLGPEITTVIVLDPDSRFLDSGQSAVSDLDRVVFEFQRSGAAALCPRLAVRGKGLLGRLQQLEFWLSFTVGRFSLRDHCVTSGVAIYRRDALVRALEKHSLSVYAEDLKNAYLLLANGEQIYYDDRLTVETAGKETWSGWFSQRVAWYFGLIKVYTESFADLRRFARGSWFLNYHLIFYTGVFGIVSHPLKMLSCGILIASMAGAVDALLNLGVIPSWRVTAPGYFLFAYTQCVVMMLVALVSGRGRGSRRELGRLLPAVPFYFFYSLAHTLPITFGYLNRFSLRLLGRRVYRDHFQSDASLRQQLFGTPL